MKTHDRYTWFHRTISIYFLNNVSLFSLLTRVNAISKFWFKTNTTDLIKNEKGMEMTEAYQETIVIRHSSQLLTVRSTHRATRKDTCVFSSSQPRHVQPDKVWRKRWTSWACSGASRLTGTGRPDRCVRNDPTGPVPRLRLRWPSSDDPVPDSRLAFLTLFTHTGDRPASSAKRTLRGTTRGSVARRSEWGPGWLQWILEHLKERRRVLSRGLLLDALSDTIRVNSRRGPMTSSGRKCDLMLDYPL